ncbi:MAG: hypothetical protein AAGJ35_08325, partial [Myxococcota bacterium]
MTNPKGLPTQLKVQINAQEQHSLQSSKSQKKNPTQPVQLIPVPNTEYSQSNNAAQKKLLHQLRKHKAHRKLRPSSPNTHPSPNTTRQVPRTITSPLIQQESPTATQEQQRQLPSTTFPKRPVPTEEALKTKPSPTKTPTQPNTSTTKPTQNIKPQTEKNKKSPPPSNPQLPNNPMLVKRPEDHKLKTIPAP